jgi:hypothetical protein
MVEGDGEKAFVGLTRLKIVARLQGGGTSYYARAQAFVGLWALSLPPWGWLESTERMPCWG